MQIFGKKAFEYIWNVRDVNLCESGVSPQPSCAQGICSFGSTRLGSRVRINRRFVLEGQKVVQRCYLITLDTVVIEKRMIKYEN